MREDDRKNQKMKTGITIAFGFALLFALGVSTNFIGIYYPRVVENQSLTSPTTVSKIDGNKLTLEDGRILELEGPMCYDDWSSALTRNHDQLEIESGKNREVTVWGNVRRTICGGAYSIRIPLIGRDENRNTRRTIAFGTDITGTIEAEQSAP